MTGGVTGRKYCVPSTSAFTPYSSNITTAFNNWKSKTGSKVSFTKTTTTSGTQARFLVKVGYLPFPYSQYHAYAEYNNKNGLDDDGELDYTYCNVNIVKANIDRLDSNRQLAVFRHEIGHVFGLFHATHANKSIMGGALRTADGNVAQTVDIQTNDATVVKNKYK